MDSEHKRRTCNESMNSQRGAEHGLRTWTQNMDSEHERKTSNENMNSQRGAEHELRT